MNEEQKITFKIDKIKAFSFSYSESTIRNPKTIETHIEIKSRMGGNKDKNLVILIIRTTFYDSDKKTNEIINLDIGVSFYIENFKDFYDEKKDILTLPNNHLVLFTSLTISTIRGVLYEKLKGTALNNVILPVVNPVDAAPIDRSKNITLIDFKKNKTLSPLDYFMQIDKEESNL